MDLSGTVAALDRRPSAAVTLAVGLWLGFTVAARLPAGRYGAHHVHPCARRLGGDDGLWADGGGLAVCRWSTVIRWPMSRRRRRRRSGALFTFLALVTGSLWGKPMWGTYWVWDARLTSFLVLLFLYLGYIALWNAIEDEIRAARVCAILALVGAVNLADHRILGRLVDHAASGRKHFREGRAADRRVFLWPLFADGGGLYRAVLHAVADPDPHRNPGAARAHAACRTRRGVSMREFLRHGRLCGLCLAGLCGERIGPGLCSLDHARAPMRAPRPGWRRWKQRDRMKRLDLYSCRSLAVSGIWPMFSSTV